MHVGVLSDTHGLLRPRVLERLAGCQHILHAGDVGDPTLLDRLRQIAPVTAVRGNVDAGLLADMPWEAAGELDGLAFRMVHRREDVPADWPRLAQLIVYGHSHRPEMTWHGSCLLLNPGACGTRRFQLPLTVARLEVVDGGRRLIPEILAVE